MEVGNIVDGNISKVLGLDKDFVKIRAKICEDCPIYSSKNGGTCNSNLWIDPKTEDVSFKEKSGYVRGCGCILKFKWKDPIGKCIIGKW